VEKLRSRLEIKEPENGENEQEDAVKKLGF
jgi:hypothetical protein